MDYGIVIEKIHQELKAYWGKGKVADYIPALAEVEPKRYGIAIETLDGHSFQVGDADIRFSIQSISKVFALAMVTRHFPYCRSFSSDSPKPCSGPHVHVPSGQCVYHSRYRHCHIYF